MDSLHMPVPASLAFRLGTSSCSDWEEDIQAEQRPSSSEGQSIFELVTANSISNCVHSNKIVRCLEVNSDVIFLS